jgi:hypothetical protein
MPSNRDDPAEVASFNDRRIPKPHISQHELGFFRETADPAISVESTVCPISRLLEGVSMADWVWHYIDLVTRQASHLDRQHWVLLSVVVLGLGMLCMRGFGSRTSY